MAPVVTHITTSSSSSQHNTRVSPSTSPTPRLSKVPQVVEHRPGCLQSLLPALDLLLQPRLDVHQDEIVRILRQGVVTQPQSLLLLPPGGEDQDGQDEAGQVVGLETEGQLDCRVSLAELAVGGGQVEAEVELSQVVSRVQL